MPYNPQIQDISGQLLARGMLARSQGIAEGLSSGVQNFLKAEEERRKTTGAIQGMLNDPYFQQQVGKDPTLSAAATKIQSGKANLSDVQQFLGSLTSMQYGRKMEMENQRLQIEKEAAETARLNAAANRGYIEAQTATMREAQDRAKREAQALRDIMSGTTEEVESPETTEALQGVMGPTGPQTRVTKTEVPKDVSDVIEGLIAKGIPISEGTSNLLRARSELELGRGKLARSAAESERKATEAERKAQLLETKLGIMEVRGETSPELLRIRLLDQMLKQGQITKERHKQLVDELLSTMSNPKPNQISLLLSGSGGQSAGTGSYGENQPNPDRFRIRGLD